MNRWEMCYRGSHQSSSVLIGVWRPHGGEANFSLVEEDEVVLNSALSMHEEGLFCIVLEANMSERIQPGDVIGFMSSNISIAFSDGAIEPTVMGNVSSTPSLIALIRAIIG